MSRKKKAPREPNPNPAVEIAGSGVKIRAGGGGHCEAPTYDGEPYPVLGPIGPGPEKIVSRWTGTAWEVVP